MSDNQIHGNDSAAKVPVTKLRKRVSYTTKMVGVTVLGVLAISGPAAAFYDDSPILIPFLELIQQALKDSLGGSLKDGFNKFATNQIKAQSERYTKEVEANMMPGAIRQQDVLAPIARSGTARATGYDFAKSYFDITGANTVVNSERAMGQLPSYNPTAVVQQHNQRVRSFAKADCSPVQAVPVDASGTEIKCSQQERHVATSVLLGANPPAEMPNAANQGTLGEVYESTRTTVIARKQLSGLALADVSTEQKQQSLEAWRKALEKPTIEELQKLTADGGVARDDLVLSQVIAKLQLENYVEDLEIKRLYAVYLAQKTEQDEREVLSPLRRAAN